MSLNIIIPCYTESVRLPVNKYLDFLKLNKKVKIIFVDDGSTDNTKNLVAKLSNKFPKQIKILSYKKNKGKGNARIFLLDLLHFLFVEFSASKNFFN